MILNENHVGCDVLLRSGYVTKLTEKQKGRKWPFRYRDETGSECSATKFGQYSERVGIKEFSPKYNSDMDIVGVEKYPNESRAPETPETPWTRTVAGGGKLILNENHTGCIVLLRSGLTAKLTKTQGGKWPFVYREDERQYRCSVTKFGQYSRFAEMEEFSPKDNSVMDIVGIKLAHPSCEPL